MARSRRGKSCVRRLRARSHRKLRHVEVAASRSRLEYVFDPVPHVVHADRDVVDLTVMKAALLALEHLERLVLRADAGEAFFRERGRNLFVARAVKSRKRP